MQLILQHQL